MKWVLSLHLLNRMGPVWGTECAHHCIVERAAWKILTAPLFVFAAVTWLSSAGMAAFSTWSCCAASSTRSILLTAATVATARSQDRRRPWSWVTEPWKRGKEQESLESFPGLLSTRPLKNARATLAVSWTMAPSLSWTMAETQNLEMVMPFS